MRAAVTNDQMKGVAALGLVLATAAPAQAAGGPRWEVNASAVAGTPAALAQGVSLGAQAEMQRRLGGSPFFASTRLGWTEASAANQSWTIDHHQFLLAAGVGATTTLGAGRLWAQAGGGATGLYELLGRQQRQRIDAAGVPGGVERSFTLGLHAFGELGVAVAMRGAASAFLSLGPTLSRITVDDSPRWRAGLGARLGVAYDF
jgi:hypothetical protein